jgi:hypothetical protein
MNGEIWCFVTIWSEKKGAESQATTHGEATERGWDLDRWELWIEFIAARRTAAREENL